MRVKICLEYGDGPVGLACCEVGETQYCGRIRMVRATRGGVNCQRDVSGIEVSPSGVDTRVGIVRIGRNTLLNRRDGLVMSILRRQKQGVAKYVHGVEFDRPLVFPFGCREVPVVPGEDVRIERPRIGKLAVKGVICMYAIYK